MLFRLWNYEIKSYRLSKKWKIISFNRKKLEIAPRFRTIGGSAATLSPASAASAAEAGEFHLPSHFRIFVGWAEETRKRFGYYRNNLYLCRHPANKKQVEKMDRRDDFYNSEQEQDGLMACESICSSWGGVWTEEKLDALEKYVNAYLTIMNVYKDRYGWKLIYFDGFAGSGSRNEDGTQPVSELMLDLFKDEYIDEEELNTYKGAAERVLGITQRGFDQYVFVDKSKKSSLQLEERLAPLAKEKNLVFKISDANEQVSHLAKAMQTNKRLASLVLLDPFGMQVDWESIEQLKGTRTDLWILIPTGVIVNRMLDRKCELTHIDKLTSFFGKDEAFLKDYFYRKRTEDTLFGETEIVEKVKKPIEKIAKLYIEQLKDVFLYVTERPLVLYNTRNTPIFHFACASNNETAIKIASHIIYKKQGQ